MSCHTTACCAVVLNQQQQTNIHQCNQLTDNSAVSSSQTKPKYCTVVEDGRVVVKPVTAK
ncbi:MAG TPA: hypothetical protein DCE56_35330 [Cyanobacteria bacterium UBA8553]|nr:hypothetical protein [Cyanobacteria bacterium UBA8553]HAJ58609.1 hypothetical protein [Cyanobacteria bacterium UBA8543]